MNRATFRHVGVITFLAGLALVVAGVALFMQAQLNNRVTHYVACLGDARSEFIAAYTENLAELGVDDPQEATPKQAQLALAETYSKTPPQDCGGEITEGN